MNALFTIDERIADADFTTADNNCDLTVTGSPKPVPGAGAFIYVTEEGERKRGLLRFMCPCGCAAVCCIPVATHPGAGREWQWNGDRMKPTTTPSILRTSGCKWHGYLTAGEFKSC